MRKISFEVSDEEQAHVAKVIQPYRKLVGDTPALLSLLYDIDLLPEQIPHMANAKRMIAICELMKPKKVFVIMGNDYPSSVFDSEEAAKAEIDAKEKTSTKVPKIYWHTYEFELNKPGN